MKKTIKQAGCLARCNQDFKFLPKLGGGVNHEIYGIQHILRSSVMLDVGF